MKIDCDTPILTQMDRFRSSNRSKEMLQLAASDCVIGNEKVMKMVKGLHGPVTGDNDKRDAHTVRNWEVETCSEHQISVEEADVKQKSICSMLFSKNDMSHIIMK